MLFSYGSRAVSWGWGILTMHQHFHASYPGSTLVQNHTPTVIPNCPCFYSMSAMGMMSYSWPHQGRRSCAKLPGFWLVSLYLPLWVTWLMFIFIDSDWSILVIWPWQSAMQFSTELSSSCGILCKKNPRFVFVKTDWKIILGIRVP